MVIQKATLINSECLMTSHWLQKSASIPFEAHGPLMNDLLDWKSIADGAGRPHIFPRPLYSQRTQSVYEDARMTGRYATEERLDTGRPMASTRLLPLLAIPLHSCSISHMKRSITTLPPLPHETSPSLLLIDNPLSPPPPSSSYFPTPTSAGIAVKGAGKRSRPAAEGPFGRPVRYLPTAEDPLQVQVQARAPLASPRSGIYFTEEQVPRGLDLISGSTERYRVLSVEELDDSLTRAFARMDTSPH